AKDEAAALLMAGWLRARLHVPADRIKLTVVAPAATDVETIRPVGPAGIGRVVLYCSGNVFTARSVDGNRSVRLESPFQPERVQPISGRPDSELMVAAMGVGGRDPLMYEALRLGA